jgi:hypothetical protein
MERERERSHVPNVAGFLASGAEQYPEYQTNYSIQSSESKTN